MRIEVHEEVDCQQWDATVRSLGSNIGHSSAWASYIQAGEPNASPCYMTLVSSSGETLGAALAFRARSPHGILSRLTGRMWTSSMPTVRPDVDGGLREFLAGVEEYARCSGDAEIEIGSSASPTDGRALEELGFRVIPRLEFEMDLEPSEDELWKGMEYKRRKNIKKAGRLGVIIRDLPGEEGIAELRRLQGDSSARIVARGGPRITRKRSLAEDPVEVLLDAGVGRIVAAELDGQIVSASLFTFFNGLVYHTLSGHSNDGITAQAPTLLLWETIKRHRQEGAMRFNFGGCKADAMEEGSPEHGVYQYKKAYGAECIRSASGHKVLRKTRHGLVKSLRTVLGR